MASNVWTDEEVLTLCRSELHPLIWYVLDRQAGYGRSPWELARHLLRAELARRLLEGATFMPVANSRQPV